MKNEPIVPARVQEINNQIAAQGNKGFSTAPSVQVPQVIDASALGTVKPLSIPNTPVSTLANGITGSTPAIIDQQKLISQADQDQQNKEDSVSNSKSKIQSIIDSFTNANNDRQTAEGDKNTAGTPAWQKEQARTYANALDSSQRAQINEVAALDKQGLTGEGSAAAQSGISRKYALEQGDLQLKYHLANSDYQAAEDTLDKQLELKLEPLKMQLDLEKSVYEDNKDSLSKSEDRAFQAKMAASDRQYQEQKDTQDTINKLILSASQQGAPQSVINSIKNSTSIGDAANAAGQYGGDMLAQTKAKLEIQKLRNDIAAQNITTTITNPNAAQYAGALNVILGSGTFTKDQKANVINAVNNGQDPFSVVKNQAKNIMGQTPASDLGKVENAKASLESINKILTEYYANGGKTSLFSGNYEKSVNKLGEVNDPKLVDIATRLSLAMQNYRLAVTGTAASVQEDQRISNVFPGIDNTQGLNTARLNALIGSFDTTIDSGYRNVLGSTYDQLKAANTTVPNKPGNDQYSSYRSQVKPGELLIERNGQVGAIPEAEFNAKTDKKI